jgi:NAD(P)H-hydrate epimerase
MKDARTIVASPNEEVYVNTSGNAGMATGGSGDLLAGMIGALLAEGMEPYESACLGVWLHGCYGDMAKERYGARTMIASDLAKIIGETE